MKWKRLIFSLATLLFAVHIAADDSIDITYVDSCHDSAKQASLMALAAPSIQQTKYEQRMQRMQKTWASLIPTHFVIQNAGNMGIVSGGIGWSYGHRRQWETDLLFGYIPRHDSSRGKLTTTIKGNFIPWNIDLSSISHKVPQGLWDFHPLTTSLYLNTVYGHEFWKSQPGRYPDKYYELMSTKFRLNVALGQRITFHIPDNKRKRHSRMALFYEVSTCDLYIRSLFQDSSVKISDILGLSIGLKFYTL